MVHCWKLVLVAAALLVASASTAAAESVAQPPEPADPVVVSEAFQQYHSQARAMTYQQQLVPVGAHATVVLAPFAGHSIALLAVQGLLPHRAYGAHVHVKPCGPTGNDAGGHYQHVIDPVQPSVDPQYANPTNEIWLDFTTDARGNAFATSTVDWSLSKARPAGSVVIHAEHTHTHPGHAGTAGARLACISV